jgi:homoserine trans-succinylase
MCGFCGKDIRWNWSVSNKKGSDLWMDWQVAMELGYRYSISKQNEIGAIFGVYYSTVSHSRARLRAKLKSSRKLRNQIHQIQEQIMKVNIKNVYRRDFVT